MEAIREVVNKQIEIINNADADASAKEIARTDLGRYFDRFADNLDKTQTNTEVAELQNVTIPAIEAIVPQNDPNANATPDNAGQPNSTEATTNGNVDAPSTTQTIVVCQLMSQQQLHQLTTHQVITQQQTVMAMKMHQHQRIMEQLINHHQKQIVQRQQKVRQITIQQQQHQEMTLHQIIVVHQQLQQQLKIHLHHRLLEGNMEPSTNDTNQNADVNNSADSQPANGKVAQPKSEATHKSEKDGKDSTNQSMVESTNETLPSADITEPKAPSVSSKDKEGSMSEQSEAGQSKSDTKVASNETDETTGKVDTDVSNNSTASKSVDAKDNMTTAGATDKATQNDNTKASVASVSNENNSTHQEMTETRKSNIDKDNAMLVQQNKDTKAEPKTKQKAKALPDTGMSHNDDLPYAELALGAGMAFLIRRFTKKDRQTEE